VGLIIWEVLWRSEMPIADAEHQLPYFDVVSSNPGEEEMLLAVVQRGARPPPPALLNEVGTEVFRLAAECWSANPYGRNHALVVRNTLDRCTRQHASLLL